MYHLAAKGPSGMRDVYLRIDGQLRCIGSVMVAANADHKIKAMQIVKNWKRRHGVVSDNI